LSSRQTVKLNNRPLSRRVIQPSSRQAIKLNISLSSCRIVQPLNRQAINKPFSCSAIVQPSDVKLSGLMIAPQPIVKSFLRHRLAIIKPSSSHHLAIV
jgi:hypothetical protein